MPQFTKKLPPKPHLTHAEIHAILDTGFRAPNWSGAARDAKDGMAYWHAVAMRYRELAANAMQKWDKRPRRQCLDALDAVALSDEMTDEPARTIPPRRLER